jgi:hypothetical protein
MDDSRLKVISDIEAGENIASVRAPFRLYRDRKRRYIRLEISRPISYSILKDRSGGFWPQSDGPAYDGAILNISAGGVLIVGDVPIDEGTILIMKITLQDIEVIDRIVGLVKRSEADGEEWLIGVEFISKEYLVDYFSAAQFDVISKGVATFDEQLRKTLNKYVYYKRVSGERE